MKTAITSTVGWGLLSFVLVTNVQAGAAISLDEGGRGVCGITNGETECKSLLQPIRDALAHISPEQSIGLIEETTTDRIFLVWDNQGKAYAIATYNGDQVTLELITYESGNTTKFYGYMAK